jgi:hypothetical protein
MSMTPPKAFQDLLDELEASRTSRKRAWDILQEIRWVLNRNQTFKISELMIV